MKKYVHTRLGLGFLGFLVAWLLLMLPSRVALLRDTLRPPGSRTVTWTEIQAQTPIADAPSPSGTADSSAGPRTSETAAQPPATTPASPLPAVPTEEPKSEAFTLDFGPFATAREADEVEDRLNQLGASTVRYRKRSDSALYAVKIGEFGTPAQARESMEQLRLRYPTLPIGKLEQEADGRISIAVDARYPLREAVALAEGLRREGFQLRIKTTRGAAPLFTLRLAKSYDLKTAQEKSREFLDQGLPNVVVPAALASSP
jgi:hypothetical protein